MLHRIMLVEDSEGEALLVKQRLAEAGFDEPLYWLPAAAEAIRYLSGAGAYANRDKFPIPEILLLDLNMPEVDGFQLLRWIRSQANLSPMVVIALTAELDPKRIALAYQLGANSYLSKDGTVQEYREFVQFFSSFAAIARAAPRMVDDMSSTVFIVPPPNSGTGPGLSEVPRVKDNEREL